MRAHAVPNNGARFHVMEEGQADGPLALACTGSPALAHARRRALAATGFRAVALDFLRL